MGKGLIGALVAVGTAVVGGGIGLGVYFGTKGENTQENSDITSTLSVDLDGDTSSCTVSQCGTGPTRFTQESHNGKYRLSANQLRDLRKWFLGNVTHSGEIAFLDGVHLRWMAPGQQSNETIFGSYSWMSKRLNLYEYPYSHLASDDIENYKYTLTHEYGHHLTQYYFKNGMKPGNISSQYRTADNRHTIELNKERIDNFLATRGLTNQAEWTNCNPVNASCGTIEGQDGSYFVNILEWITRDFSALTIPSADYDINGTINSVVNVMSIDNAIREKWGVNGGNVNIKNSHALLNNIYKKIIGIEGTNNLPISSLYQTYSSGQLLSSFTGFIPNKNYKCIVSVENNKITKTLPIHTHDMLFKYNFVSGINSDGTGRTVDSITNKNAFYSDYFGHTFFKNSVDLAFSENCDVGGSDFQFLPGTPYNGLSETFLAGIEGRTFRPQTDTSAFVEQSKGRIELVGIGAASRYKYYDATN